MTATIIDTGYAAGARRSHFYLWMAVAMAATAFLGFAPTFWMPMAQGIPERNAVLAIHGALFFGWTLFVIYQAWLVGSGNVARHRNVGMIGVSLATAMTIFGLFAAIDASKRAATLNFGEQGETFMVVPLAALLSFVALVFAALLNIRRSEWHKRLMLSATAVLLDAPIARPFIVYIAMGGHPPPFRGTVGLAGFNIAPPSVIGTLPPSLAALLFIVVGMVHDWRTLGRVHPAYWWAGGFALGLQLLKIPLSDTAVWHGFARFLVSLAG
jgi:hypothetical protein